MINKIIMMILLIIMYVIICKCGCKGPNRTNSTISKENYPDSVPEYGFAN